MITSVPKKRKKSGPATPAYSPELRQLVAATASVDRDTYRELARTIGRERIGFYSERCEIYGSSVTLSGTLDKNSELTLAAYELNILLAQAFFAYLHYCEVYLRNCIHRAVRAYRHEEKGPVWFHAGSAFYNILEPMHQQYLVEAVRKAGMVKPISSDADAVACLGLGFWNFLLLKCYRSPLYGEDPGEYFRGLSQAFPGNGPQDSLGGLCTAVQRLRKLRDRIAHHRDIIFRNAPSEWLELSRRVISACSPETVEYVTGLHDIEPLIEQRDLLISLIQRLGGHTDLIDLEAVRHGVI